MGTEILRPHDCLIERITVPSSPVVLPRQRNSGHANFRGSKLNRRSVPVRHEQGRRFVSGQSEQPSVPNRYVASNDSGMARRGLTMEKVSILRRGGSLHSHIKGLEKDGAELATYGTNGLRRDQEMVPKQTQIVDFRLGFSSEKGADVYAGSAFAMSPAPSSLPLPSFSKKKQASVAVDDSATRNLRRLLRLE